MDANHLKNLISGVRIGSQEALEEIYSLVQDVNSIFLFLDCLQSSDDVFIKQYCIFMIRRMIIMFRDDEDSLQVQSQQEIFDTFANLIPNEQDDAIRNTMGDIVTLLKLDPEMYSAVPCTEFSFSLIESKQDALISTALLIIYHIYNYLPPEQQPEVLQTIYPTAVEHLMSSNSFCRKNAMILLKFLLSDASSYDIINDQDFSSLNEELSNMIMSNVERINNEPADPGEIKLIYQLANVSIVNIDCFAQFIEQFAEMFLSFLSNEEIDPKVRYSAELNIEHLFKTAFEQIEASQEKIIETCINLSIEVVSKYPEERNVNFDMISWLQSSLGPDEVYRLFYKDAMELINSNDIVHARVAFDILECIVITEDSVMDDMDDILDLIFTYLDPKNNTDEDQEVIEFIPTSCANIISTLCSINPDDMSVHVETLIPLLFEYLYIPQCLGAIISLTEITELPPEKCEEFLQKTLELIDSALSNSNAKNNLDPGSLIELLISFLEMIKNIDEAIYSNIIPLVQSIMESADFSPSEKMLAVDLFGQLINICPESTSTEIESMVKFSLNLFSDEESLTHARIVEFLSIVLQYQSKYIEPFIDDLFETLFNLLEASEENLKKIRQEQENEEVDDDEESDEESEESEYVNQIKTVYKLQYLILDFLSNICPIYPNQTSTRFEQILSLLQKYIREIDESLVLSVINDFDKLSEAYEIVGSDISPLLYFLIQELDNPDILSYDTIAAELWKAISMVMANGGQLLISRAADDIIKILSVVLFKERNVYNQKGDVEEIGFSFRLPVFMVLDTFVEELGSECLQYIEPFIDVLDSMANNRQKKSHCFAARSLAKIASVLPQDDENCEKFMTLALQIARSNIEEQNIMTRICGMTSLNIILNHRPDLIEPIKDEFIEFTSSMIQKSEAGSPENEDFLDECSILFLSMVRIFNLFDEDLVSMCESFINFAAIDFDKPNLISFALFADFTRDTFTDFYLHVILLTLSSSHMILRKFEPGKLAEFAQTISSLSEDEIIEKLQWNFTKFDILQRNISEILGESSEA